MTLSSIREQLGQQPAVNAPKDLPETGLHLTSGAGT